MVADKYAELCYKHDGCRILQAMVKYGNRPQRILVVDKIKPYFLTLMSSKYSHYLATKAYYFAPEASQKQHFRSEVQGSIQKLILHSYAAEVVEYIYCQSTDVEKREMVFGLYGNYFLLLKEFITTKEGENPTLAGFIAQKPQLGPGILDKLEPVVLKLVHKGHTRHTICQAILADYIECQTD